MLALSIGILEEIEAARQNEVVATILLLARLFQELEIVLSHGALRRDTIRWPAPVSDNEVFMQLDFSCWLLDYLNDIIL